MFQAFIVLILVVVSNTNGNVLRVGSDFETIQLAVDHASERDTILLEPGRYIETVIIPARGLMIASEFIFSGDSADVTNCIWQGVMNGNDSLRCILANDFDGNLPELRVVGIRFVSGIASATDFGGAIRIHRQVAQVDRCRFDSCAAGVGGAISLSDGSALLSNCRFTNCGHFNSAAILDVQFGEAKIQNCTISESRSFEVASEVPEQFQLRVGSLRLVNSELTRLGFDHYTGGTVFVNVTESPDTVEVVGCFVHGNRITSLVSDGSSQVDYLRVDSNEFSDNALRTALYSQDAFDSLTIFQVIGNSFIGFNKIQGYAMHGLFALDTSYASSTIILRNLIYDIHDGHTSFCSIWGATNGIRIVKRNYVVENSNHSVTWPPSGQVLTIGTGDGELEENMFMGNQGYAVFQGNLGVTSYARHNYWNHATGPYDSVGNIGGQGDTVDWRVHYQPWATDTNFVEAVTEPREPVETPQSFIGNAYPNPFNSDVTIEFVLLSDQEITLDIFDLTGRRVETVLSGRMNKGVHIRDWRPESQASGIYFVRLSGEKNVSSTVKLLYMK